ncbi:L-threonine ammonia-lyase-like isoform X2 [Corticium candelabrum]|uniref:L-threonine ammonia-lyase-like isoform X2 n=1 Tax=Corticium candelabrum TaxID=121492 RepID=UPI002E25A949|nr:L-threonine ammonia-lyase-like isoform X2 [Corticium candelabrum]
MSEIMDKEPVRISFEDITAASFRIRDGVVKTLCEKSQLSESIGMELYFKKEFMQYTGSFKERGARNTLKQLTKTQKEIGVIAASAGNHALALAYHGKQLGIPVTVVMPTRAPIMKVTSCRECGATVIIHGDHIGHSKDYATKVGEENGYTYINGYDHPAVLAGQGTIGLEIIEQVPDVDAVVVPVGGGGLLAGIAVAVKALKPEITVIAVESENCPGFSASWKAGHPVKVNSLPTLADGLAVPLVGSNAFATAQPFVDKVITISENHIAIAILRLVENEKAVVEGAGATGFAACIAGMLSELKGKKVVIPLCGGNIDTTLLGRCLERGLAADGRLCRFVVTVRDTPGGCAELTKILSEMGACIKDIFHERAWVYSDIFSVEVCINLYFIYLKRILYIFISCTWYGM